MSKEKEKFLVWLKVGIRNSVINEVYAKRVFEERFKTRIKRADFLEALYEV